MTGLWGDEDNSTSSLWEEIWKLRLRVSQWNRSRTSHGYCLSCIQLKRGESCDGNMSRQMEDGMRGGCRSSIGHLASPCYQHTTAGRKTLQTHTCTGGISTTDHLNSSPKIIWIQWWNNNEETNDNFTGPLQRKINSKPKTSQHSILNDASDKVPAHKHVLGATVQSSIFNH